MQGETELGFKLETFLLLFLYIFVHYSIFSSFLQISIFKEETYK